MKFVTFEKPQDGPRVGVLRADGSVLDLAEAARLSPTPGAETRSLLALIEAGAPALDAARALDAAAPEGAVVPQGAYALRAPLPAPPQLRDFLSFEKHLLQAHATMLKVQAAASDDPERFMADVVAQGRDKIPANWYKQPVYYKGNRFAVSGPDDVVAWPAYSQVMDYELELACVIGKGGRDIPKAKAREHIFGFTIFNDFSARDAQSVEMPCLLGPAKGKDFDGANAFGPCLVTLDEIGDPYDLEMVVRVNGEERGRGHSSTMHWSFEDAIAHVSNGETLYPGEILGSGTVGNGSGLEFARYLEDGDMVELEIDRIGVLRNQVRRG